MHRDFLNTHQQNANLEKQKSNDTQYEPSSSDCTN
jgi:hypothetical protein